MTLDGSETGVVVIPCCVRVIPLEYTTIQVRWVAIKKMDQRGDPRQNELQSININMMNKRDRHTALSQVRVWCDCPHRTFTQRRVRGKEWCSPGLISILVRQRGGVFGKKKEEKMRTFFFCE